MKKKIEMPKEIKDKLSKLPKEYQQLGQLIFDIKTKYGISMYVFDKNYEKVINDYKKEDERLRTALYESRTYSYPLKKVKFIDLKDGDYIVDNLNKTQLVKVKNTFFHNHRKVYFLQERLMGDDFVLQNYSCEKEFLVLRLN